MKIGLLGGTFDPIHLGHLIIAEWIKEELDLNKIIFIPTNQPPHKINVEISEIKARWEMVEMAIRDNPDFEISDIEIKEKSISYSVDTIKKFAKNNDEIYFIIGEDSLRDFPKWKNPDKIVEISYVVVAKRRTENNNIEKYDYLNNVIFCDSPEISISSTVIRNRIKTGKSVGYLLHPAVEEYIKKNNIYK